MTSRTSTFSVTALLTKRELKGRQISALTYVVDDVRDELHVYVGTNSGDVIFFKTSASSAGGPATEVASTTSSTIKNKKVSFMEVVGEVLVVLCTDAGRPAVFLRDNLQLVANSGCEQHWRSSIIAVNATASPPQLCVGEKRRLTLYDYRSKAFKNSGTVDLPHTPKFMEWIGNVIAIGFNEEYAFYDTTKKRLSRVPGLLDSKRKPLLKIFDDQVLVVGKDNVGVFVDFTGVPVPRNPLIWKEAPRQLGFCKPYIVSLFEKHMEVHRFPDKSAAPILVQSVPVPDAKHLSSINDDNIVLVAEADGLKRLIQTSASKIIERLLGNLRIEEAKQLLRDTTRPKDMPVALISFHRQAAVALAVARRYEDVEHHWSLSRQSPDDLIVLVPEMLPTQEYRDVIGKMPPSPLRDLGMSRHAKSEKSDAKKSLYRCVATVLEKYREESSDADKPPSCFSKIALDTALLRLLLWLNDASAMEKLARSRHSVDIASVEQELRRHSRFHVLALLHVSIGNIQPGLLIWQRLGNGTLREKDDDNDDDNENGGRNSSRSLRIGIDSTIEVLTTDIEHVGDDSAGEAAARIVLKFSSWVLLRVPRRALSIFLVRRATPLPIRSVCECLEQADAALREQRRRDASDSSPAPMLLQTFLERVLYASASVRVSDASSSKSESDLSDDVSSTKATKETKTELDGGVEEIVLYPNLDANEIRLYTTKLGLEYLSLIESTTVTRRKENSGDSISIGASFSDARAVFRRFLDRHGSSDDTFDAVRVLRALDGLSSSARLVEEMSLLRGILGRHRDAIELLLRQRPVDLAEKYCLDYAAKNAGRSGNDDNPEGPMLILLSMLLKPTTACATPLPKSASTYQAFAVNLMMKHARPRPPHWNGLNPLKVLDIIPESLPLASLMPYLAMCIPSLHHRLRSSQVSKHLTKYDTQILLREKVLRAQNRKIVIDRDSRCCVSGEPIEENMVFAVFPNGRVSLYHNVHGKDLSVDPVSGERFTADDSPVRGDALPEWLPSRRDRARGDLPSA